MLRTHFVNRLLGHDVMKQLAQYQDGRLELQDVPDPVPPPGGIVVRTTHSVISAGTERMQVEQARMNLLQKARARPDQVRKVLDTARTLGWQRGAREGEEPPRSRPRPWATVPRASSRRWTRRTRGSASATASPAAAPSARTTPS